MMDIDSILLKDQPIAREGVLEYRDRDGRVIRKLKRWKDLKQNIGRTVYLVDEHPSLDNGKGGLFNGQKRRWGVGLIKRYKNYNMLCADIVLDDGAPIKDGYSIGYPYTPIIEKGSFNGDEYDMIQADINIDHIAITVDPREPTALQTGWDSGRILKDTFLIPDAIPPGDLQITSGDGKRRRENKREIAYDSYRVSTRDAVPREQIRSKMLDINPNIAEDELEARVDVQFINQFRQEKNKHLIEKTRTQGDTSMEMKKNGAKKPPLHSEEIVIAENPEEVEKKRKKKEGESLPEYSGAGGDSLVLDALRDLKSTVSGLHAELDSLREENKTLRTEIEKDRANSAVKDEVKFLKTLNFDANDFDGKPKAYIEGMKAAAERLTKPGTVLKDVDSPADRFNNNDWVTNTHNFLRLDHDSEKFRLKLPDHMKRGDK